MAAACPCGSGDAFAACCRPLLRGERDAATAGELMRSRYTAFVRRDEAYLLHTWSASTRPATVDTDGVTWLGLDVLATTGGQAADAVGTVTFAAHFRAEDPGRPDASQTLREHSSFAREEGRWVYVDGVHDS
ncbi:YchJ family protein [Demequina sp. NBRC 110057]|uniref:YchJ family protein n=1 Tax=Demequina sp. NBRC 110057 TaxID=1570346 RepID=UPI0009FE0FF9|nr:YchJ family metal-binding protein [Demequina sp. NBRC 110057]